MVSLQARGTLAGLARRPGACAGVDRTGHGAVFSPVTR